MAVLEQCLANTLGDAAMGLAVHDHRVDGTPDIVDALSELGVRHIEMPATPERVWRAIQAARPLELEAG